MTEPSNLKQVSSQWQTQWGSGYIALSKMGSASAEITAKNFIRCANIKPMSKILDMGCGHGRVTELLVKHTAGLDVVGIDLTRQLLDSFGIESGTNDCDLMLVEANIEVKCLPFADGEFDAAVSSRVFHYLHDPMACLMEARRVVKVGGVVAISVPNRLNPVKWLTYRRAKLCSPAEVAHWFSACGFHHIAVRTMCFLPSSFSWHGLAYATELAGELPALGMLGGNVLVCGSV